MRGRPGIRGGPIFQEMSENLLNTFIFRVWFQEAIQNGRKNPRFCLRKLHLSPRISSLNQLKSDDIVLEANVTKKYV